MKYFLLFIIRFYRNVISPLKPSTCRFDPTCSQYALQAIERYGAYKGFMFTVKRVIRCHPFNRGGYDPLE